MGNAPPIFDGIGPPWALWRMDFMAKHITHLLAVPAIVLTLSGCGINSVPTKEEAAKAAWGNVEAAYQRRADLIPNLVNTAGAYLKQEKDVLVGVTEARAKATSINLTADDLSDPVKVEQFQAAQGELSGALGRLMVVMEQYPQLKSDTIMAGLMDQLEGTENRINVERGKYNEAVQDYNTTIRTFPDAIGAKIIHGAEPMTPFKAEAGAEKAPTVDFNN